MSIPAGWSVAPLQELCEFHNGLWKGKKGPFVTARIIRNTNFTADGRIDLSDVAVLDVEERQLAKRELQKNDIIIEKSGGGPKQPVGRVVLFDLDDGGYSFSNFTSVIRIKQRARIDPVYLHRVLYWWYVSGVTELLQKRSTGIRNLDFNAYKALEVPYPQMAEQKRIVATIDQAFAALNRARAHAEANLADADSLYASTLDELIRQQRSTWNAGTVSSLVGEVSTGPFGSLLHKRDYIDGGVPIINPSNVVDGVIEPDWSKTVSADAAERLSSYRLNAGDLVIGRRGEMGRCAPVLPEMEGWLCGTGSFIIRPKPDVSSEFVSYLMRSPMIVDRLSAIATGATMPNLSNRALAQMPFELPAYEVQIAMLEQIRFLEAKTSELRSASSAKLADIAALRQSLLQQAFSGQLT